MSLHSLPHPSPTSRPNTDPTARDFARVMHENGVSHVGVVRERIQHEPETRMLLEFGLDEAPLYALGEMVTINFPGPKNRTGDTRARVLFRTENKQVRRYELLLATGHDSHNEERRRFERQRAETDVHATLRAAGRTSDVAVTVHDITLEGVALHGEPWIDRTLLELDDVELTIDLEDDQAPVKIAGRVVYRRLVDQRAHYGIEFRQSVDRGVESIARLDGYLGGEGLRQAS